MCKIMTAPTCPGFQEREGTCDNAPLPEVGLCVACAQLKIQRTPQERGCEVRWGFGSEGEML